MKDGKVDRFFRSVYSNPPSRGARIVAAITIGLFGAALVHAEYRGRPGFHSDFGMVWYGARALWAGQNPYLLIGPGRSFDYAWGLIYPATALVVVMPLAPLSEHAAAVLFVGCSSALLGFAITSKGWHLLPLLASEPFLSSARLGQWSLLITAGVFLPWISIFAIAKPQASIPVLVGSESSRTASWAVIGGAVLLAISLALLPSWPIDWIEGIKAAKNMEPPVARFGGVLILAVLLRWRRPESWLVLALACMPQSWGLYGALPLLTIPDNIRESIFLAFTGMLGLIVGAFLLPPAQSADALYSWMGAVVVFSLYLPVVTIILRRPNIGAMPFWLRLGIRRALHRQTRKAATSKSST